jgi:uracil-DNA glycosylase family 4
VLEAPNHVDTYDPDKGYLTIDKDADPSISFFLEMYTEVLELDIEDLFITNSVLCLPKKFAGKYPVTTLQRNHCSMVLKNTIDLFKPKIVCTIGFQALKSLGIIEPHGFVSMKEAVGNTTDWYGRTLFPLYHTSTMARICRSRDQQVLDWLKLRTSYLYHQ